MKLFKLRRHILFRTHFTILFLFQYLQGIEDKADSLVRILEDGSNTDNRIGSMSLTIPGNTPGPVLHWHRMHDETFLVTKGRIRFTTDKGIVDTKAGDYVVVPTKAIHTFSNPFEEEAVFFNTFTPAYYVDYLRMLADAMKGGQGMQQTQKDIMAQFATFEVEVPGVEVPK
jgi:mannose-6-phosphate isomerase-like protein (cupin superfamily)